jgi:hypothetical protein
MSAYRGHDLTPLFVPSPAAGVGYRQGVLLSWNSSTFVNAVDVDGIVHTDLSVLNTAGLAAGQVVAILTVGTAAKSWVILGRLITP